MPANTEYLGARPGTRRVGALATVALHGLAVVALLTYEPARSALLASAPIMVEWLAPPKAEPEPPAPPQPKPVAKRPVPRPIQQPRPVLAAPVETPSPVAVPAPPPPPPPAPVAAAVAPAPAPVAVTPPAFNADYLDNPAPAYPPLSRRMGEQGRVVLRVLVNERGAADDVQVRASSGHARLDDAARQTVRQWKFVPAKRGSEPVAAWVLVPISFNLEG